MTSQDSMDSCISIVKNDPLSTYQIIEKIGEGSHSTIYKALNKITDKLVAIKIFPLSSNCFYDDEIDFLRSVDHPFIDKFVEIYQVDQQMWMVTDYCPLGSISDIIKMTSEPLSEAEISCISYNVLYALDYIHTLNKSHGSVKANNIMVNSMGQIKLTDLGNRMWGGFQDDDYTGDMWALGLCLIEIVEGNSLLPQKQGQKLPSFRTQQLMKTSTPPSYSSELKDFIAQCLQVDPKRRPKASKLFDHPFICKYKKEFSQIRKKLLQDKMEKMSEFRRNLTARVRTQPEQLQNTVIEKSLGGEENIVDESDMTNTTNTMDDIAKRLNNENTIEYTLESDNYLHSAVKPSFNLTEDPSHIEISNRNHANGNIFSKPYNIQDSISHIKHVPDESNEQSFNITARSEQLSVISQSSRLCFTAAKKNARVPPLKLNSNGQSTQGKLMVNHNHYKSENMCLNSKENQEAFGKSIMPFKSVQTYQKTKPKMYKATNESNFVVKHRISMTTMNTHLNCSIDTETTLNPISADRQKSTQRFDHHGGPNSTRQLIEGLENFATKIPRTSAKDLREYTVSTATGSKGSSCRKSIFQTPHPNDWKKDTILKVVKENLDHGRRFYTEDGSHSDFSESKGEATNEVERKKLESQMKKELEEIKKKYNTMFRGLGKSIGN